MSLDAFWERRVARIEELRRLWPFAREVLEFFSELTRFQKALAARVQASPPPAPALLAEFFPDLIELVEGKGPAALVQAAADWRRRPPKDRELALDSFWRREAAFRQSEVGREAAALFFPKAILQPYAMALAAGREEEGDGTQTAVPSRHCPGCGHPPALSILVEDQRAGAPVRFLACSLCARPWRFPRLSCPACGEERPEKLPRYSAAEFPWLRIEACDACRRYLKGIDLAREPAAEVFADEIASAPLDVIARGRGYEKITPNLAGI